MRRALLPPVVLCAALLGCGGKGGDNDNSSPPSLTPRFACSDSAPAVNEVVLRCSAKLSPDIWQIDLMIGSPTTATNICGFLFDIVFDPAFLEYYPDSTLAENFFFQQGGGAPLISAVLEPGDPGRLVIGIAPTGTCSGFQGKPGFDRILTLSMRVVPGATFDPQLLHFENAQALDPTNPAPQPITSISFSDRLFLSNQ